MGILKILLRLIVDSDYRRQELQTDKKSMLLLIIGLPSGSLILFMTLLSLPTIFGEERFYSAIEKVRPFVCSSYSAVFKTDICSE